LQHGHTVDQGLQPFYRILAVLLLAARGLRLDDDHAIGGDALVVQCHQALLDLFGQR
jgi:hypothetical protein